MSPTVALPLVVALVVAAVSTSTHRRLPPRLAARFVTVALVLLVLAAAPTALVVGLAFLAHSPVGVLGWRWCAQAAGLHDAVPTWLGVPIVALSLLGAVRTVRLLRRHRELRLDQPHPIHVADSDEPFAVTLPGRAGQIVISSALVDLLDDDERGVVVAHEEAHARHRHDRYLLAAELAATAIPPLRAMARRVSYSVERWADEAAAAACGDRRLVAVTLGKVALQSHPPTVAGFAGLGVASRMSALLAPPITRPARGKLVALWTSLAVTAGLSLYQLHHLERLLAALCPH